MKNKVSVITLLLFTLIAASSCLGAVEGIGSRSSDASALPTLSTVNQVPDFYAEGKGDAYLNTYVKLSPRGGYLNTGSEIITLTPWGYVTTEWNIGKIYIIFFANVTETDFYIAYLYLTNSSTPMILRLFNYRYATLTNLQFTGIQYVFARFATTTQIQMPTLSFVPKARSGNTLSAIGAGLYINQNAGQVVNETSRLNVFPLLEQYFQGPTDYNEIWSLMTDDSGGYYFGIFYMPNSDPNHVILEHQVKLNDYEKLPGRTFDAIWTSKGFLNRLTVHLPKQSQVMVEGFPVQTNSQGVAIIYLPKATVTVEAPHELESSIDTRMYFSSWMNHGDSNPLAINTGSVSELTANYVQQFLLTIDSQYGSVQGAGWYPQSSNATFNVPTMISSDNGTRRVFVEWQGDYSSTTVNGTITMNSPRHVTAIWKTQFAVKLQLVGVPANATAQVTVNGQAQSVTGSAPAENWVDANTQLSIGIQSTEIDGSNASYNFSELRVDDQPSATTIIVTKPITIAIVYTSSSKAPSTLELNVAPSAVVAGYPMSLTGRVTSSQGPSTVTLYYSSDNTNWDKIADVSLSPDGTFSYTWQTAKGGTFFVRAFWQGDSHYAPVSQIVSVRVEDASTVGAGIGSLPVFLQEIFAQVSKISVISSVLGLAGSLLALGAVIGGLLMPGGSSTLGYLIGSLLIGLVFIFPITAIVLSVKAARSHRSPRIAWLMPLVTIWAGAFVLLITNGLFLTVPPALLDAIIGLLAFSNAILTPLALSIAVARSVAV